MLASHGKTERSDDFFEGTVWGAGSNPSISPRGGMGAGDVDRDTSGVSLVNLIDRVGSGKCADGSED